MLSTRHVNLLAWRTDARRRVVMGLMKRSVLLAIFSGLTMALLSSALDQYREYRQTTLRNSSGSKVLDAEWRAALPGLEQQLQARQTEAGRYQGWLNFRDGQLLLWSLLSTQTAALEALKQVRFSEGRWEMSLGLELADAAEIARQWQQREPEAIIEVLDRRAEDGGFTRIRLARSEADSTATSMRSTQP
ncbi:hypothetical protein [Carnimonas bestiolae]|uniref:hypothetical protein n=1 Tax=Carnimonas bestiolae TaxID=3402172 RepID=UPI003EDBE022